MMDKNLDKLDKKWEDNFPKLEAKVNELEVKVNTITSLEEQYKQTVKKYEVSTVMQGLYSRRLNIIVFNIKQGTDAWEDREVSMEKVRWLCVMCFKSRG